MKPLPSAHARRSSALSCERLSIRSWSMSWPLAGSVQWRRSSDAHICERAPQRQRGRVRVRVRVHVNVLAKAAEAATVIVNVHVNVTMSLCMRQLVRVAT
eukprot:5112656-Pleurochrysis_carterae.AAC.2